VGCPSRYTCSPSGEHTAMSHAGARAYPRATYCGAMSLCRPRELLTSVLEGRVQPVPGDQDGDEEETVHAVHCRLMPNIRKASGMSGKSQQRYAHTAVTATLQNVSRSCNHYKTSWHRPREFVTARAGHRCPRSIQPFARKCTATIRASCTAPTMRGSPGFASQACRDHARRRLPRR
jgi:hypothetical protein